MKLKHTWQGDDMAKLYRGLSGAVSQPIVVEALKAGAEPIRSTAAALAPRSAGKGPHLADNIIIAESKFGASGNTTDPDVSTVVIGPRHQPSDHFYGMFQETGTANHPAHPFMRPAWDAHIRSVMKIVAQHIRNAFARVRGSRG